MWARLVSWSKEKMGVLLVACSREGRYWHDGGERKMGVLPVACSSELPDMNPTRAVLTGETGQARPNQRFCIVWRKDGHGENFPF